MPHPDTIFLPVAALALWTLVVLMLIPVVRIRAAGRGEVRIDDFRTGESGAVPEHVSLPNRNYMNLLELPLLFYVACIVLFTIGAVGPWAVAFAWSYVGLRMVHSCIHLTTNHVPTRGLAFGISNVALLGLWVLLVAALLS
jgi:hypothetical protein